MAQKANKSDKEKQHYLPKFWSKFYMHHAKSIVGLYDADDNLVRSAGKKDTKGIKDIVAEFFQKRYLYETDPSNPDNIVENLLGAFEIKVRELLFDKLYDSPDRLSDGEMDLLFRFVNVSVFRHPDFVYLTKSRVKEHLLWSYQSFMRSVVGETVRPFGYEWVRYSVAIMHVDTTNSKERFILGDRGVVGDDSLLIQDKFPCQFVFFPLSPTIGVCLKGSFWHKPATDNHTVQWVVTDEVIKRFNDLQIDNLSHGHYLKPII